jgi:hypothetical protein
VWPSVTVKSPPTMMYAWFVCLVALEALILRYWIGLRLYQVSRLRDSDSDCSAARASHLTPPPSDASSSLRVDQADTSSCPRSLASGLSRRMSVPLRCALRASSASRRAAHLRRCISRHTVTRDSAHSPARSILLRH